MTSRLRLLFVPVVLMLAVTIVEGDHCEASEGVKPIETSVCAIQANPRTYDKKIVSFEGRIRSDGIEGVGADDLKCPDKIVGLFLTRAVSEADGIDALLHAIYSGRPGTIDKDISARVTGVMNFKPQGRPPIVINVTKVENIKMTMKAK